MQGYLLPNFSLILTLLAHPPPTSTQASYQYNETITFDDQPLDLSPAAGIPGLSFSNTTSQLLLRPAGETQGIFNNMFITSYNGLTGLKPSSAPNVLVARSLPDIPSNLTVAYPNSPLSALSLTSFSFGCETGPRNALTTVPLACS